MRYRVFLPVIAVVTIASLIWSLNNRSSAPTAETLPVGPSKIEASPGASAATVSKPPTAIDHGSRIEPISQQSFVAAFYSAKSSREALRIIQEGVLLSLPQANDAMLELDGVCASEAALPANQPWIAQWFSVYCAGYSPIDRANGAMNHSVLQEMSADQATKNLLTDMLEKIEEPKQGALLMQVVSSASSPYEVRSALQFAAANDIVLPFQSSRSSMDRVRHRDELNLAAEKVFCRSTGSCGPGSLPAIRGCLAYGVCNQGFSLEEIHQQSVSPQIFASADALANKVITGARDAE